MDGSDNNVIVNTTHKDEPQPEDEVKVQPVHGVARCQRCLEVGLADLKGWRFGRAAVCDECLEAGWDSDITPLRRSDGSIATHVLTRLNDVEDDLPEWIDREAIGMWTPDSKKGPEELEMLDKLVESAQEMRRAEKEVKHALLELRMFKRMQERNEDGGVADEEGLEGDEEEEEEQEEEEEMV